ncbi:hypothetical protein K8R61_02020, partial [bacterium]|nr:hypothetical protein [bacterium]
MKKKFNEIHNEIGISPLTQSVNFGYPSDEMRELLGIEPFSFICVYSEDKVDMFTDLNCWQDGGNYVADLAKNNLNFFINLYNKSEKLKKETIDLIQKIGRPKKINLDNQELIKLFENLSYNGFIMTVLSQPGAIADHYHNIFSDLLDEILDNVPGLEKTNLNKSEIFNILTSTSHKLPSEIAKEELRVTKDIKRFLDKWHWVHFGHLGSSLNEKNAQEFLESFLVEDKDKLKKHQEVLEDLIFEKEEDKNVFRVSRIFIYLKGMRMEVCNGVFYIFSLVLNKIAEETGYDKDILYFLTVPEVIEYLKSGKILLKKTLESRRKF